MPEVLMEALCLREHAMKPTWVVDQFVYPLDAGHLSYSPAVADFMSRWTRLDGRGAGEVLSSGPSAVPGQFVPGPAPSSAGRFGGGATGGTTAVGFEDMGFNSSSNKKNRNWKGRKK